MRHLASGLLGSILIGLVAACVGEAPCSTGACDESARGQSSGSYEWMLDTTDQGAPRLAFARGRIYWIADLGDGWSRIMSVPIGQPDAVPTQEVLDEGATELSELVVAGNDLVFLSRHDGPTASLSDDRYQIERVDLVRGDRTVLYSTTGTVSAFGTLVRLIAGPVGDEVCFVRMYEEERPAVWCVLRDGSMPAAPLFRESSYPGPGQEESMAGGYARFSMTTVAGGFAWTDHAGVWSVRRGANGWWAVPQRVAGPKPFHIVGVEGGSLLLDSTSDLSGAGRILSRLGVEPTSRVPEIVARARGYQSFRAVGGRWAYSYEAPQGSVLAHRLGPRETPPVELLPGGRFDAEEFFLVDGRLYAAGCEPMTDQVLRPPCGVVRFRAP